MDHAEPASIEQSIVESWSLPGPIHVTTGLDAGTTSDVFAVRDGTDRQFIAKLVYDCADRVEVGLRAAEAPWRCSSTTLDAHSAGSNKTR